MKRRKEDSDKVPLRTDSKVTTPLDLHSMVADQRQEIANLKRELRTAIHEAHTDELTGIFNRKGVINAFSKTLVGEQGIAFFIDLDKFKPLNDTFGHKAGDEALKIVAQTLQKQCRKNDMVGRIGGDEFLVILDDVDANTAAERMKEFQDAFETMTIQAVPMKESNEPQTVQIQGTIGVAPFKLGDSFEMISKTADANMYERKKKKGPSQR